MAKRTKLLVTGVAAVSTACGYILGRSSDWRRDFPFRNVTAEAQDTVPSPSLFPAPENVPLVPFKPLPPSAPGAGPSSALTVGPHRVAEIMKFGFPTTDTIRSRSDYVLAYDRKNRTALWVAEHLTNDRLALKDRTKVSRKNSVFQDDQTIHPYFRSSNEDYWNSGFDRGHLAAAANHSIDQESLNETFFLSNISPQVGVGFNRGEAPVSVPGFVICEPGVLLADAWNKLEQYTRFKTKSCVDLFVMTGPLYLPSVLEDGKTYVKYQVIGLNNVAVPTHFFKAILCQTADKDFHLECFMMPNKPIDAGVPLQAFQVPPDVVERVAGFILFEGLPRAAVKTINGRKL